MFQNFIKSHSGSRWSYNGYLGECLSLAKLWVDTLAGKKVAPASGNGKGSGYYTNFPSPLGTYFTKQAYSPHATYPAGSLVVYTKSSHIGMLIDNQVGSLYASVFEQNADPDGSPAGTHQRPKSHIDGICVLKVVAPTPTPSPSTGQRIYFSPVGQTATFYKESGGTYKMVIKDASYNWAVLENHGTYVVVSSALAGGRCRVYLIDSTGKTIPGRSVK